MDEEQRSKRFHGLIWSAGAIWGPVGCLVLEVTTHMCRETLFDPLPTFWHVPLILTVPAAGILGRRALEDSSLRSWKLGILVGVAACTVLLYVGPFLLLLPLSILALLMGIGVVALLPLLSALAVLMLAAEFRRRRKKLGERPLPGMWTGFLGCILLLALLDVRPALTTLRVQRFEHGGAELADIVWVRDHGDRATLDELAVQGGGATLRPLCELIRFALPRVQGSFVRQNWRLLTGELELPEHVRRQLAVD